MTATATLTMADGIRIVVPDSLHLITPYVLREQEDWFEDEIRFLRRHLRQGGQAIDIGANYGTYALSMAHAVGADGAVWAFEPASRTAQLLRESIAANCFTWVSLEQSALSDQTGTARLALHDHSELNALVHAGPATVTAETVTTTTLDACLAHHGWDRIDVVKIDAEGEEARILAGGTRFFAQLSPLVQYEVKAGNSLHLDLVQRFAALGYRSYRLVPGLDLLIPFDATEPADGYLLNLFCCKADRAEQLAADGILVDRPEAPEAADDWYAALARLPYAQALGGAWRRNTATPADAALERALGLYQASRDPGRTAASRIGALLASLELLRGLCRDIPAHHPAACRLHACLARVARDLGARSLAVQALGVIADTIFREQRVDLSGPFLAPLSRFDAIPPGPAAGTWFLAAVLEGIELLGAFSSFYTGLEAGQRLETIRSLGFADAAMERRLRLLRERFAPSIGRRG